MLAHLSDPHLPPMPKARLRDLAGKQALGYLNWTRNRQMSTAVTCSTRWSPTCTRSSRTIAVTGDLVNLALEPEFSPAAVWLESVGTPADVTVVPGNHDAYVRATRHRFAGAFGDYLRGDAWQRSHASFPFVRRRGPVALIGVSSAVPRTPPLMATGRHRGGRSSMHSTGRWRSCRRNRRFGCCWCTIPCIPIRASNGERIRVSCARLLHRHGVELVLHGHDHIHSTMWFDGPKRKNPGDRRYPRRRRWRAAIIRPPPTICSRSRAMAQSWRCEQIVRGFGHHDSISELQQVRVS